MKVVIFYSFDINSVADPYYNIKRLFIQLLINNIQILYERGAYLVEYTNLVNFTEIVNNLNTDNDILFVVTLLWANANYNDIQKEINLLLSDLNNKKGQKSVVSYIYDFSYNVINDVQTTIDLFSFFSRIMYVSSEYEREDGTESEIIQVLFIYNLNDETIFQDLESLFISSMEFFVKRLEIPKVVFSMSVLVNYKDTLYNTDFVTANLYDSDDNVIYLQSNVQINEPGKFIKALVEKEQSCNLECDYVIKHISELDNIDNIGK